MDIKTFCLTALAAFYGVILYHLLLDVFSNALHGRDMAQVPSLIMVKVMT